MSETIGHFAGDLPASPGLEIVHEAYSFACMRCGHLWEQSFEIEHHVDARGQTVVAYRCDGRHVPSPLTRPTCANCGGHLVRIMQAGAVNNPLLHWPNISASASRARSASGAGSAGGPRTGAGDAVRDDAGEGRGSRHGAQPRTQPGRAREGGHHWHLPSFLHFHRKSDPAA
ncbi:hypothetical protein [Wenjunlia tyrosinilytica]|uniref:C2H2-type domain-containing protein n=1 Tax=Wenjunlia tyrosinilytica TaxID=1544741 RepID=A0A918DY87_9ACTN|nr:hypothetical protein [Wenjunlia tyrosinilytica]GGO88437.1 hypothetical protein GCM10012280_29260 [Wenjunlia tyrosinilytica]